MGRHALGALVLVALTVALTGCGSKKSASGSPAATTTAVTPTTTAAAPAPTTGSAPTTTSGSSGTPSFASTSNCVQLASLASKVARSFAPAGSGTVDLKREAAVMEALARAAPAAIRPDFETFAAAYANFVAVYQKAGLTLGKTPTAAQLARLQQASHSLATPKVEAAINHLTAWGKRNCGGLTSTSP